jgi:hypothetical protein
MPVVVLEVYSGRENPFWTLDENTLQAVNDRLRKVEESSDEATPPPPVLGYRGFRIENLGPGAPDTVFVGRGTVTLVRGRRAKHRPDTADLESLLLTESASRGFSELLETAGAPTSRMGG